MRRFVLVLLLTGCGDDGSTTTDGASGACALTDHTTATGRTSPSGCEILERDTSSCDADREAAGITGMYRHFSCRVTLSTTTGGIVAVSDGQPDSKSNYFAASNACHEDYTGAVQNPNTIAAKTYSVTFPTAPDTQARTMNMTAVVGLVVNGVPIYGNFAAPGDDIFTEARTFDRCGGHPQMQGAYHNHAEPLGVSYDDDAFIGVMRDGYAIYGRKHDGAYPTDLDQYGGHISATPDSTTPVFHYHVNEQTSTGTQTAGEKQWFLTTGMFRGAPGACTGCN